ncbi:helix-turn-helix domain-containing protein [uncultured Paracoccus sp.]|uniref:helix-turn-helix domain-containing protein n=1 Tax=uncultured Paracoccus sp. TaxID=189685 RepID=UPI002619F5D7|nr:helix-turn-helix domain-containing protein [uncultured Paracoccus sp.]
MTRDAQDTIPKYFLYGDPESDPEMDFLHVEAIPLRSGANAWTIPAHSHPDHLQFLLVECGGGEIQMESLRFDIPPPALVVVPAAIVHQIRFRSDTDGQVITAALGYGRRASNHDARALEAMTSPAVLALQPDAPEMAILRSAFAGIAREYVWQAPARRMAIRGEFQRILVTMIRLRAAQGVRDMAASDRDYDILLRYREEVEAHYRSQKGLDFYAARLGVSTQRLTLACKSRGGRTASAILHQRLLVEAKRFLIFRTLNVAEIGYLLGFDDPAYFSRFFAQRVGMPPGAFRAAQQDTAAARQNA